MSAQKIVPLTGQTVKGPLGLAHLPRLWLKCTLSAAGLLPEGYLDTYLGSNQTIVDMVGLDPDATFAFLKTKPEYRAFETWVKANAENLNARSIAASNAAIDAQVKPAEKAAAVRAMAGVSDASLTSSPLLNALDDWETVRLNVLAHAGKPMQTIVPAISSQSEGPLGLKHLPRLWLKALLNKNGALFDGWKSGQASGFDKWFSGQVGVDLDAMVAFIHAEQPQYMVFEAWFARNAAKISPAEIAQHNALMMTRAKPDRIAAEERVTLGIDDPTYNLSFEMNDLVDWLQLHEQFTLVEA
jgi:hypothetical protein